MTKLIFVIPAEDTIVINPETNDPTKAEGEEVNDSKYWRRRLEDKSITIGTPPKKSK